MRLLLTGATGFVGNAFFSSLTDDVEVVYLGRRASTLGKGEFYEVDISDPNSVKDIAKEVKGKFDAIVHMAAHVPKSSHDDNLRHASLVNIDGLIHVLDSFEGRFNKIILGSSAEVYDQSRVQGEINEDTPVNPSSYYGATKLASEFIARTYAKKNSIAVVVLRFSVMYGPSDPIARALPNFIKSALNNEDIKIQGGESLRDYVHIDDVVRSIHCALVAKTSGVFNIGTGSGVSIYDAAKKIIEATGSRSKILKISGPQSADIIINTKLAESELGFLADSIFPQKLEAMVNSYR